MNDKEKEFIKWAQKYTCLLCDYPLDLRNHLHHIIAKDDGGPDHYLNLVALCPNHHYLIEIIKRYIIPNQKNPTPDWLNTGISAIKFKEKLNQETKDILDILSKPHRFSNVIKNGIPVELNEKAAEELSKEDLKLLDFINKKRPRIFLPQDSLKISDDSIDIKADKIAIQVTPKVYSEVISLHMEKLNLTYKFVGD